MRSKIISRERIKIASKLEEGEACLVEHPIDLFYLTGLPLSAGKLIVHPDESVLFVDGRYLQMAQEGASFKTCLDEPCAVLSFFQERACKTVLFDGQNTSYESFLKWKTLLKSAGVNIEAKSALFRPLRVIKDDAELEAMKKSAKLLWRGFEFICSLLEQGITEKKVSKCFEIFCLQQGADELSFEPIIAFGANSAMPHYHSQDVPLKIGDSVLIDIGVVVDRYHSDMTRVVFYKDVNNDLRRLYTINKAAQKAALEQCFPGTKIGMLDRAARRVMQQHDVEPLFLHSLGHGIGLQTHEFPRIKYDGPDKDLILEPGMVFTVEPGLYLPGLGGVRYEDTIAITEAGFENFYPDAGEEPIVL